VDGGHAYPDWYTSSQAIICLFSGGAILSIWLRGTPERERAAEHRPLRDPGLGWLSAAVLVWGVLALWLRLGVWRSAEDDLRIFASTLNSALFLLAAAYFDYGPERLKPLQAHRTWRLGVFAAALVVATLTAILTLHTSSNLLHIPDFVLSLVTLLVLGYGLVRSFRLRGFGLLAALAVVALSTQAVAQIPEVRPDLLTGDARWVLVLTSKTMAITTFLALAMSWAHEEAGRPASGEVSVRFTGLQENHLYIVELSAAKQFTNRRVLMTETPHKRFLMFAAKRLADPHGGWIHLRSASLEHKDLARICQPTGLPGRSLFENDRAGSYRLSIPPENIRFDLDRLSQIEDLRGLLAGLPQRGG
jgi:hypothetical protein